MKALSVKQPYAGLIASKIKIIETRSWYTKYRGDLLICSGKIIHPSFKDQWQGEWINQFGKALCIVKLFDCKPMIQDDEKWALCKIYDGAWSWHLSDIRQINPFDVKGQLGLFEVDYPEKVI